MNSIANLHVREEEEEQRVSFELDYILKFQRHCDRYLSKIANPQGKSVLVIGCGYGTEMMWCIRNGVKEVIGLDSVERDTKALDRAIKQYNIRHIPPFKMLNLPVEQAETLGRQFDLVLSNNVFEHLPDIDKALKVCKQLVNPDTGRIAIFTDPLFYSSMGSHLPVEPWEHLWGNLDDIKSKVDRDLWGHYMDLNQMTLLAFIKSIVRNELVVLKLETVPDRNMKYLSTYLNKIQPYVSVTDLTIEGICVELAPPGGIGFFKEDG